MADFEIHIQSYFSLETNLAEGFGDWSELVGGTGYDVILRSESGEEVSTTYVHSKEDDIEERYVRVKSNRNGPLFQRALGHATYLLSQHSDSLMIHKWD